MEDAAASVMAFFFSSVFFFPSFFKSPKCHFSCFHQLFVHLSPSSQSNRIVPLTAMLTYLSHSWLSHYPHETPNQQICCLSVCLSVSPVVFVLTFSLPIAVVARCTPHPTTRRRH